MAMVSDNTKKTIAGILALLALAALAIAFLGQERLRSQGPEAFGGQYNDVFELQRMLRELENVEIDTALFEAEAFVALEDRRQEVRERIPGRPNPFMPIGTDPVIFGNGETAVFAEESVASSTDPDDS